ncbi:HAD-IIB family hydrolase [Wenxinia saemankumensis]|uniref:sucrose-phosphate synthase n=1 Tax=Wenxinia saemankumensis TaxID=1447782 RepID=A0A1M6ATY1_9RHOB|nr:HAD-IIB family hydrolase [Wenxinia saemankumensis]SHI39935.1 sucrose-phosphate synthase [Wenxinia saemankumensis]
MHVIHVALGGCLRRPPVAYGLTEDTGGHIAYVLGAAMAQAERPGTRMVEIVTRAFDAPALGACHAEPVEEVAPRCRIRRLRTARRDYLSKEALEAEIPALSDAFLAMLAEGPRPDVIHAHFADAAVLARAAEARFGIPWIYHSHSLGREKSQAGLPAEGGLARRIAREDAAIAGAGAIVASSRDEAERQLVVADPGAEGRIHRVSPGVATREVGDPDRARALLAPHLDDPDKPVVLAVARPIAKKNLGALVEGWGADPDLVARSNLVIVAGLHAAPDATDEAARIHAALAAAVERLGLRGRVALPPHHDGADIAALYALAARGGVFVNPAHHEPFGLTLIEAAQADVPVVATRNGGPVDILRNLGSGELVDPADPADIARGIRAVLEDPQARDRARRAGSRARRLYSWQGWAARVEGIAASLHARAPRPGIARHLFASDLDGTLTGDRAAAARFAGWHRNRPAGLHFAIATGRSLPEARRVLAEWDLPMPDLFLSSVGTEIWRPLRSGAFALCPDWQAEADRDWDQAEIAASLAPIGLRPQAAHDQRRWKLSFVADASGAQAARHALDAAGLPALVVHSHDRLLDVLAPHTGKAAAVRFEARRLGLAEDRVAVAGDSGNDLDMLQAFAGILPANASPETAPARTAWRAGRPHADGVLDGLARLGLAPAARPPRRGVVAAE